MAIIKVRWSVQDGYVNRGREFTTEVDIDDHDIDEAVVSGDWSDVDKQVHEQIQADFENHVRPDCSDDEVHALLVAELPDDETEEVTTDSDGGDDVS